MCVLGVRDEKRVNRKIALKIHTTASSNVVPTVMNEISIILSYPMFPSAWFGLAILNLSLQNPCLRPLRENCVHRSVLKKYK